MRISCHLQNRVSQEAVKNLKFPQNRKRLFQPAYRERREFCFFRIIFAAFESLMHLNHGVTVNGECNAKVLHNFILMPEQKLQRTMMIKAFNGGPCTTQKQPLHNPHFTFHTSIIVKRKLILKKLSQSQN